MSQLHAFFLAAAVGYLFGVGSIPLLAVGYPLPFWGKFALQTVFCLACAAGYPFLAIRLGLPPLRLYLLAGLCLGFFLYWKTLRKMVAFFIKKGYNIFVRKRPKKREHARCPKRSLRKRREGSR